MAVAELTTDRAEGQRDEIEQLRKRIVALEDVVAHADACLYAIFTAGLFDNLPADARYHDDHSKGVRLLEMLGKLMAEVAHPPLDLDHPSVELDRLARKFWRNQQQEG